MHHQVDALARIGAVADDVAQAVDFANALRPDVGEDDLSASRLPWISLIRARFTPRPRSKCNRSRDRPEKKAQGARGRIGPDWQPIGRVFRTGIGFGQGRRLAGNGRNAAYCFEIPSSTFQPLSACLEIGNSILAISEILVLILAFDTSGFSGSVALLDRDRLLDEERLDAERRSARTLAPAIDRLLKRNGKAPGQVGLIATTVGPGSFTGLRVGVTTAKTLAYAIGAEIVGLSTLEIACRRPVPRMHGPEEPLQIEAVLDAQRGELFVGQFRYHTGALAEPDVARLERLVTDQLIAAADWLARLRPKTIVTGSGLKRLADQLPEPGHMAPTRQWDVEAANVGRLAWRDYVAGRRDDLWKLAPVYLRPSYAEEKAAQIPRRR